MNKFGIKLAATLGLSMSLALASCGGGGGDPGTPLFPPTAKLIMTPNIAGVTLGLGYSAEPVKISGGQPPYYVGATGGVVPTILDDGTVYLRAVTVNNTNTSTDGSNTACQSTDKVWVQDSSYNQKQIEFGICVFATSSSTAAIPLSSTQGDAFTLSPGGRQSVTVYGGTAPYTATSSNPSVATVASSGDNTFVITAGNNASVAGTKAGITVTDAAGNTLPITVTNVVAKALAVSPTSLSGLVGSDMVLTVTGGVTPYKVTSSYPAVATASARDSSVAVNLVGVGSSTLTIQDATQTTVTVVVTSSSSSSSGSDAGSGEAKALAVSPTSLSGVVGNNMTISIVSGVAPFTVTSSFPAAVTATVRGSTVAVNLVGATGPEPATLTIQDATQAVVPVTVTVDTGAASTDLSVSPQTQAITTVSQSVSYTVKGGTGPYYVSVPTAISTATSTMTGGNGGTPTSSLISVSPQMLPNASTPLVVKSLACVKQDYVIPLTITDMASNESKTVTVQLLQNDTGAGCL